MPYLYDPINCIGYNVSTKDANKAEGFVITSATISGDKLIIKYNDLLNNETGTETFSKSEAMGFANDPWNTWKGNTKSVIEKFIGGKVHDADLYYHFKSSEGEEYFGTEADLKDLISHFTPAEKKEW